MQDNASATYTARAVYADTGQKGQGDSQHSRQIVVSQAITGDMTASTLWRMVSGLQVKHLSSWQAVRLTLATSQKSGIRQGIRCSRLHREYSKSDTAGQTGPDESA